MEKKMKKIILLAICPLLFFVNNDLYATTAPDYVSVLENISEQCPYGRHLIFRDTNGDGEYDTVRKTECNGSYSESPMTVKGNGSFGRIGAHAEFVSGSWESGSYSIRIYFPTDNTTLGFLEKQTSNPVAVFTFSN